MRWVQPYAYDAYAGPDGGDAVVPSSAGASPTNRVIGNLCYIAAVMTARLAPEEIAAVQARREQARANTAIEGLTITPAQEALFAQFDAEGLSHDERRRHSACSSPSACLASPGSIPA